MGFIFRLIIAGRKIISVVFILFILVLFAHEHSANGESEEVSYSAIFFRLALQIGSNMTYNNLRQVHLMRVPKASSTSLSIIARRLVNCNPYGPCCKYPGDPPGSCPSKNLFQCQETRQVIGCTHHYPHINFLNDKNIFSLTILRNPYDRAISAFFYPGIRYVIL